MDHFEPTDAVSGAIAPLDADEYLNKPDSATRAEQL